MKARKHTGEQIIAVLKEAEAGARVNIPFPQRTNERWSMGFVTDSIVTGRRLRALVIIDDYSRFLLCCFVSTADIFALVSVMGCLLIPVRCLLITT